LRLDDHEAERQSRPWRAALQSQAGKADQCAGQEAVLAAHHGDGDGGKKQEEKQGELPACYSFQSGQIGRQGHGREEGIGPTERQEGEGSDDQIELRRVGPGHEDLLARERLLGGTHRGEGISLVEIAPPGHLRDQVEDIEIRGRPELRGRAHAREHIDLET